MAPAVGTEPEFSPKSRVRPGARRREKVIVSPPLPPSFAGPAATAARIDPPATHTAGALKTGSGRMPSPAPCPRGLGGSGLGSGQCRARVRPHPSPKQIETVPLGAAQCRQPGGGLAPKLNRWAPLPLSNCDSQDPGGVLSGLAMQAQGGGGGRKAQPPPPTNPAAAAPALLHTAQQCTCRCMPPPPPAPSMRTQSSYRCPPPSLGSPGGTGGQGEGTAASPSLAG